MISAAELIGNPGWSKSIATPPHPSPLPKGRGGNAGDHAGRTAFVWSMTPSESNSFQASTIWPSRQRVRQLEGNPAKDAIGASLRVSHGVAEVFAETTADRRRVEFF